MGYMFAGMADREGILVHEISFDENGFMIKLSHDLEVSSITDLFSSDTADEVLRKYPVSYTHLTLPTILLV